MKRAIAIIFFSLVSIESVLAATYNSTSTGGNWNAGGTWVGGSAPPNNASHTANIYGNITANVATIQQFALITLNDGKSFTRTGNLSLNAITAFNVIDGNIIINGNLTLTNSTTLTITSGSLTVTGTLTVQNGSTINFNSSGSLTAGSYATGGSGGTLNMNNGSLSVTGLMDIGSGSTTNIASSASATIGSVDISNTGGRLNVYGDLKVTGTVISTGRLSIFPGGVVDVDGAITAESSNSLIIGTNVAPPPYADLIARSNLNINGGSASTTVEQNGRVVVLGNVTATGGSANLTINNGGQMYVDGNLSINGGSASVVNNNSSNPYGLYINGTATNTGGSSSITSNRGDEVTLQNTNVPFYNYVQSIINPLPVTLLYLAGKPMDKGIILSWSTVTEENAQKFQIERSSNGIDFNVIGEVTASGNSNIQIDYSFEDLRPLQGRNYYRLRTIDFDYSYEFSKTIAVQWESPKEFVVYPNPLRGTTLNVNTNFNPQENDTVVVLNSLGVELARIQMTNFEHEVAFGSKLKPGVYFLRYISDHFEKTVRVSVVD